MYKITSTVEWKYHFKNSTETFLAHTLLFQLQLWSDFGAIADSDGM